MFGPVTIPFGAKMLFNTITLRPGVTIEDVELALGEMCNMVKEHYGGESGGFIAGQVFEFSGFISDEGSVVKDKAAEPHLAIVTYWLDFERHEASHRDALFREKFAKVAAMCSETRELGYDMLWQGAPET